jgi:hypothetical protein
MHSAPGCGATSLFFARGCAKLFIISNNRKEVIQCLSALSRGVPRPCRPVSRPGTLLVRRPLSRCKPERGFRTALELRKRPWAIKSCGLFFFSVLPAAALLEDAFGVLPRAALLEDVLFALSAAGLVLSACLFALPRFALLERIFDVLPAAGLLEDAIFDRGEAGEFPSPAPNMVEALFTTLPAF